MQIKSDIELNEHTQGIQDTFGKQEIKANVLGKRIFWKYGYNPIKIHNFNDELFSLRDPEGTDHGIDDVIYKDELPKDDPLNLKQINKSRFDDTCYTIDYKSNNFTGDLNSVYVKLMPYRGSKSYFSHEKDGKTISPLQKHYDIDQKKWKKARKKGKNSINSIMERLYNNKQLLGSKNFTDYFLYLKYSGRYNDPLFYLTQAYLVPGEALRNQVINVLNGILENEGYPNLIQLRKRSLYLNHKILKAYLMVKDKPMPPKSEIELFKPPSKKEIVLRIPEDKLIPHIKFDECGEIIYNDHLD